MATIATETTSNAQEVKVFCFTYEKTHTETACVYVPAKTKEEAEAFIKTQEDGDLEYNLETDVMQNREDYDCGDEWELSSVELESETVEGQTCTWDYDEHVVPALNPEEEED
jgi:hypothetical protein